MALLDTVKYPSDLRKLKQKELPKLASEVRERILTSVSETGGHLAPSLGAVEFTIAMHYVYDTPNDKIVWDVGHQTYAHKILTGRNEKLSTIRQYKGISGFPNIKESEYDALTVGHASTSISAALGMATARDIKKESFNVVAVIGDGAMTGGLALEGLNNAGVKKTNLTVILNDNSMSIAKNVGAMSKYLTKIISDPLYNKIKSELWELTGKMSKVGSSIRKIVRSVDESVKHFVIPGKLFEDLGFRYFGVIDGHNIDTLIDVFRNIKRNVNGPVLIHIQTKKGKGYRHAEKDATKFHGISKFEKKSGEIKSKPAKAITYTNAFSQTLVKLGKKHKNLLAITAAMPDGTGTKKFSELYPERFFDVGIAEGHAVTFAAGAALEGMKPVVAIYSTFLQRALDQIIHDIALTKLPVVFCLDRAGIVGDDGPTHHGNFDISYLRLIPGVVIMSPKDETELCNMLNTAVEYSDGPTFIRYPRGAGLGVDLPKKLSILPIGKPEVITKGKDVLILAFGEMVESAINVSELLASKEINASVVNARFAKPVDTKEFLSLYKKYDHIVTMESNTVIGGFGSAVRGAIGSTGLIKNILNLGYPDQFIEHGSKDILMSKIKLDTKSMTSSILKWYNKS